MVSPMTLRKSELGASMVGVLVAAAITGIVAVAMSTMFKNQSALQRNSDQLAERLAFLNEIRGTLGFPDVCTKNFAGFDVGSDTNTRPVSNIVSADGSILYATGKKYGNGMVLFEAAELKDPQDISTNGGKMTLSVTLAKAGRSVGETRKTFDTTLFYHKSAGGNSVVACDVAAPRPSTVLKTGDLSNNGTVLKEAIVINEPGFLMLSGFAQANCNPATTAYQAIAATLSVDNVVCSVAKDNGWLDSAYLYLSGSCAKKLGPGSHDVEIKLNASSCTNISSRSLKLQYAVLRSP